MNLRVARLKTRGVAMAIAWINPAFLAVGPDRLEVALSHADLTGHGAALLAELDRMPQRMPTQVATLAELLRDAKRRAASAVPGR